VKTILVGYDGTRAAERALTRAGELAQAFGAKVVVVSIAAPEPGALAPGGAFGLMPYYYYPEPDVTGPRSDEALWKEHRQRVEAFFTEIGVPAEFVGLTGEPVEEIVEVAEARGADLIVVGTREPGFFERLLGGSVSQGVARRAQCDVLIVHAPEESPRSS
jgi:nucleotide-binding universal stress UspA family protein